MENEIISYSGLLKFQNKEGRRIRISLSKETRATIQKNLKKTIQEQYEKRTGIFENVSELLQKPTDEDLEQLLIKWGEKFQNWQKEYEKLYSTYFDTAIAELSKSANTPNFTNAARYRLLISEWIRVGKQLLEQFTENFNIKINLGVFREQQKDGNLSLVFGIDEQKISVTPATTAFSGTSFAPAAVLARIKAVSAGTIKENFEHVEEIKLPPVFSQNFDSLEEEIAERYLLAIDDYFDKAISQLEGVNRKGDVRELYKAYANQTNKKGEKVSPNFGVLGEGVIKSYLMYRHMASIGKMYYKYRFDHPKKKLALLGGTNLEKSVEDFKEILKTNNINYILQGDFEYRQIWDSLKRYNKYVKDVVNPLSNRETEESKNLYNLYLEYINQKIQIKESGQSGIRSAVTVNAIFQFANSFQKNSVFLNKIKGYKKEEFSEVLQKIPIVDMIDFEKLVEDELNKISEL